MARSRRVRLVLVIIAAACCISASIVLIRLRTTPERRYARLVNLAATLDRRPVEARIVGYSYAPYLVTRGILSTPRSPVSLRFRGAAGEYLLATQSDDQHLHERGVATLVSSDPTEALRLLERAASKAPSDASVLCDLAAARLTAAAVNEDVQMFASALAAADAALRSNPASPEARFNRALALDRLQLHEPAAVAYQHYLEIDGTSPWSLEARRNLAHCIYETEAKSWDRTRAAIERPTATVSDMDRAVRAFPYNCRAWGEAVYLPSWADNIRAGRPATAEQMLTLARKIGEALRSCSGESLLSEAVGAIDRAHPQTRNSLVKAYVAYNEGRKLIRLREPAAATTRLGSAYDLFKSANSPMSLVTQYYLANTAADGGDDQAAWLLLSAARHATPPRYATLTAQIAMLDGVVLARRGRVHEALARTLEAANGFGRIGDRLMQTQAEIGAAAGLTVLGRPADAWKLRKSILEYVSRSGDDMLFEHALNSAARDSLADHHPDVAEALINVELTHKTTSARLRVDALLCRLQAMSAADLASGAATIRSAVKDITDPALREEALDDIRFAEAVAVRQENPPLAEQLLSQTIAFRMARANQLTLPPAYVEHGRTLRLLRRDSQAIAEFEKAIDSIEQQRQTITRGDFRDSFGRNAAAAYDELFDIRSAHGEYDQAFSAAERGRAYRIVEQLTSANTTPAPSSELHLRIPPGLVLAEISTLPDRVVLLALDSVGLHPHVVDVSASQIASEANDLLDAVARQDNSVTDTVSAQLYDQLVAPLAAHLSHAGDLVIIPDAATASIPFAMLKNAATGKYLIEEVTLTFAPSAATYVQTLERAKAAASQRPLIIGDPEFKQTLFPGLPRLPNAESEARQIGAMYPSADIRTGRAASRHPLLIAMESASLIHVAAHAVANDRDPSLSVIPLAPDSDGDGLLYVREIASMRLRLAPVVVLAGCRTASVTNGPASVSSLATAFLAAGARSVVGTLWDIDDDIAADASVELHEAMSRGEKPSTALRSVQLRMLRTGDVRNRSPRSWSGLQTYGSGD